jgi:hypothetical protein
VICFRVAASQEGCGAAEWEAAVSAALGPGYARLGSVAMRAIGLALWGRRSLAPRVRSLKASSVATGVGGVVGNKGGVALSLSLERARLLFVGAHFAAHDGRVARRNADFHAIRSGLFARGAALQPAPRTPAPGSSPAPPTPTGLQAVGGVFRVGSALNLAGGAPTPPGSPSGRRPGWPFAAWDRDVGTGAGGDSSSSSSNGSAGKDGDRGGGGGGSGGSSSGHGSPGPPPQEQQPQHLLGGWKGLVCGGGGGGGGGGEGGSRGVGVGLLVGWRRGVRVAPLPLGDASRDDPPMAVEPRAASCPPGTLSPAAGLPLVAPTAGRTLGLGGWGLEGAAGAHPADGLPFRRVATATALATGRVAGTSCPGSPAASRRPSFLFPGRPSSPAAPPGLDATEQHDAVFWLGVRAASELRGREMGCLDGRCRREGNPPTQAQACLSRGLVSLIGVALHQQSLTLPQRLLWIPSCPRYTSPQDLNYRINGGRRVVAFLLRTGPVFREVLHANDQLAIARKGGAVFEVRAGRGAGVGWPTQGAQLRRIIRPI